MMFVFQTCNSARTARGGREAPAPWGGGSGAALAVQAHRGILAAVEMVAT